jgi:branched-chain amino acid transport system ATP-binding protein
MGLEARGVTIRFGGVVAVNGLDLDVRQGEIVALIGPNGAGKTTFINCVSGAYVPQSGRVTWKGGDILGLPPNALGQRGVSRTFQNVASLHDLTVLDIVRLGRSLGRGRADRRPLGLFTTRDPLAEELTETLLAPLGLADARHRPIQMLSYGHRKAVDLARAIAAEPELLLLDEPVAGLSSREAHELADVIRGVQERHGCTILMVEHKMDVVNRTCDRIVVMAAGSRIFDGSSDEVQVDPEVRRVYLGER